MCGLLACLLACWLAACSRVAGERLRLTGQKRRTDRRGETRYKAGRKEQKGYFSLSLALPALSMTASHLFRRAVPFFFFFFFFFSLITSHQTWACSFVLWNEKDVQLFDWNLGDTGKWSKMNLFRQPPGVVVARVGFVLCWGGGGHAERHLTPDPSRRSQSHPRGEGLDGHKRQAGRRLSGHSGCSGTSHEQW
ncbi:hypothetical protein FN846DRAFT_956522 [Sphaerosporella brunnea]|uniref:Uncharacterized protein n=1 Tax=Sphaerosporella brunnea TaxID=1250544 RepID=A0A5J5ESJ2_9PEZI|nr:hypothetical protein FN846DRAFT_956522 [Sphaerosporella brunnea]